MPLVYRNGIRWPMRKNPVAHARPAARRPCPLCARRNRSKDAEAHWLRRRLRQGLFCACQRPDGVALPRAARQDQGAGLRRHRQPTWTAPPSSSSRTISSIPGRSAKRRLTAAYFCSSPSKTTSTATRSATASKRSCSTPRSATWAVRYARPARQRLRWCRHIRPGTRSRQVIADDSRVRRPEDAGGPSPWTARLQPPPEAAPSSESPTGKFILALLPFFFILTIIGIVAWVVIRAVRNGTASWGGGSSSSSDSSSSSSDSSSSGSDDSFRVAMVVTGGGGASGSW